MRPRLIPLLAALLFAGACADGESRGAEPSPARGAAAGGSSPEPSPLPDGVPPDALATTLEEVTAAEFEIAGEPDWLAIGFGSVWVSRTHPEEGGNKVDRIDPSSNRVVATIPAGSRLCQGLVAGHGSVWAPACRDHVIARIDPKRNAATPVPVSLPVRDTGYSGVGEGALWVLGAEEGQIEARALMRIDPASRRAERHVLLDAEGGSAVAAFGSVWVSVPDAGTVVRVDPNGGGIIATVDGLSTPRFMAAGDGALWVLDEGEGSVARIDPETNTVAASITVGKPGGGGGIAVGAGSVWVRPANYLLARIDPKSGRVVHAVTDLATAGDVAVGFGSVWISAYEKDRVWRLDL